MLRKVYNSAGEFTVMTIDIPEGSTKLASKCHPNSLNTVWPPSNTHGTKQACKYRTYPDYNFIFQTSAKIFSIGINLPRRSLNSL